MESSHCGGVRYWVILSSVNRLAIVTCGPQVEVALSTGIAKGVSIVRLAGVSRRSSLLLAAVDLLFEDGGIVPADLDQVLVSRGPGSFTGIRAGLATAIGLVRSTGAEILAYDSLMVQAARVRIDGEIWAAQPGKRGELYAQSFVLSEIGVPETRAELQIIAVSDASSRGVWIAPEPLDLGGADRIPAAYSAAEGLLRLATLGREGQSIEPLYFEEPPVSLPGKKV